MLEKKILCMLLHISMHILLTTEYHNSKLNSIALSTSTMSTAKFRNFRCCANANYDEETITSTPTLPSKPSAPKPKKLSETLLPRSSKPSQSHHCKSLSSSLLSLTKSSLTKTETSPSNVQPQAGAYTKEAFRELQKNTLTLATPITASRCISSDPEPS
jgi:GC-rich sequence DNA-binding factor